MQTESSPAPWLQNDLDIREFPIENDLTYGEQPTGSDMPLAIPLPSRHLRATVSDPELGQWLFIGQVWAQIASYYLPENASVFDLGCGVGKTARFFYLNKGLTYVGVDIFWPAIEWCKRSFYPLTGDRFRFEHFDGISAMYNPQGKIRVRDYQLPAADNSIDMTICASLFTHLYEHDAIHYLRQICRITKPGGKCLLSHLNDGVPEGENFHGNEQMMLIKQEYLIQIASEAGLKVERIMGKIVGQDAILLVRP